MKFQCLKSMRMRKYRPVPVLHRFPFLNNQLEILFLTRKLIFLNNQLEEKFARFEALLTRSNIFFTPKLPVTVKTQDSHTHLLTLLLTLDPPVR